MSLKKRVVSYVRAFWPNTDAQTPPSQTLGEALQRCLTRLPNAKDTVLEARDGFAAVRHRWPRLSRVKDPQAQLLLHICTWVPEQRTSTVPHATDHDGPLADLDFQKPGKNWDFLRGDGMVLVSGNHCLLMRGQRLHPATMRQYLSDLLAHAREKGADIDPSVADFEWQAIADSQSYQEIQAGGGIKRIHLSFGHHLQTALRFGVDRRSIPVGSKIWQGILDALGANDRRRTQIREAHNINAYLTLSLDQRRPGLLPEELTDATAALLSENGDDLTLQLANGNKIKKGELLLRKEVSVEHAEDRVRYGHAFEVMREYFRSLVQSGAIER